jgi:hypothetical protein
VSESPDRREVLMMCVVTRMGRRTLQRSFHHEGKRIMFDGAAGEVGEAGFNYISELLAEADRALVLNRQCLRLRRCDRAARVREKGEVSSAVAGLLRCLKSRCPSSWTINSFVGFAVTTAERCL